MPVDPLSDFEIQLERIVALAVCDAFYSRHQADAAHLTDQRQALETLQPFLKVGRYCADMLQDSILQQFEVSDRERTADWMAGIGVAVGEHRIGVVGAAQVLEDLAGHHDAAEREVTR